jgi:16S rRNA (guanine966-N2)-methyltransferase
MAGHREGRGWVRVIAGRWRGLHLETLPGKDLRPTADRVREALFSILGDRVFGARVVDAFAGTGALGIEALSRGAAEVVFIERDPKALDLLRRNLAGVGAVGEGVVVPGDALRPETWPKGLPADLVLADPPYRRGLPEAFLAALVRSGGVGDDALVVIEHEHGIAPGCPGWIATGERRYGDSALSFFRVAGSEEKGVPHADGDLSGHL